jgi:hypothetical protein
MRVEVFLEADALAHGQSAHWTHGVVHGAEEGGLAGPLAAADGGNSAQMWRNRRSIGDVKRPSWIRGKVRVEGESRDHITADSDGHVTPLRAAHKDFSTTGSVQPTKQHRPIAWRLGDQCISLSCPYTAVSAAIGSTGQHIIMRALSLRANKILWMAQTRIFNMRGYGKRWWGPWQATRQIDKSYSRDTPTADKLKTITSKQTQTKCDARKTWNIRLIKGVSTFQGYSDGLMGRAAQPQRKAKRWKDGW